MMQHPRMALLRLDKLTRGRRLCCYVPRILRDAAKIRVLLPHELRQVGRCGRFPVVP